MLMLWDTHINVLGDWIYYVNNSDDLHIYKIKTDGTGRKKLSDTFADYMTVVGDYIYYSAVVSDNYGI